MRPVVNVRIRGHAYDGRPVGQDEVVACAVHKIFCGDAGTPGTGNFVGEFMILFGSYRGAGDYRDLHLLGWYSPLYTAGDAASRRVKAKSQIASREPPGMLRELFIILLLVVLLVLLGFYPQPILIPRILR